MLTITKAQWIATLRSGKFKQTTGKLKDERGYCCLGVAAKVAGHALRTGQYNKGKDEFLSEIYPDVFHDLGLTTAFEGALTVLNDDDKLTFAEIADYIEANLP